MRRVAVVTFTRLQSQLVSTSDPHEFNKKRFVRHNSFHARRHQQARIFLRRRSAARDRSAFTAFPGRYF
jgi:hypothetical protein